METLVVCDQLLPTTCYLLSVTRYYLKLKCANCGEVPDRWQYITHAESQPVKERRRHLKLNLAHYVSFACQLGPVWSQFLLVNQSQNC